MMISWFMSRTRMYSMFRAKRLATARSDRLSTSSGLISVNGEPLKGVDSHC